MRILIIGAGPTGLSTGRRLLELGHDDFTIYEQHSYAGGLCASFRDEQGFTWDLGGHVIFSQYPYFNQLFESALHGQFYEHTRKAWIYFMDRWVPYPFQNNLRHLPREVIAKCVRDLRAAHRKNTSPENFKEWIMANMGEGIAQYFMLPYNEKVWAYPLEDMSADWITERVSRPDVKEVVGLLISDKDRMDWGPNSIFKFPAEGGTGQIFHNVAAQLAQKIQFDTRVEEVDLIGKSVKLSNGARQGYDVLVNTSPLDLFTRMCAGAPASLTEWGEQLAHNRVWVVGVGLKKGALDEKSWGYFPQKDVPFFRATYFSNYSPRNVPGPGYRSFLCETAYSEDSPFGKNQAVDTTIAGLLDTGLIAPEERSNIVSTFSFDIPYAYPIPTLNREKVLARINPLLEEHGVFSRGRFGAWRYEVGNTDHSVMQGKEIADRIVNGTTETVWHG
ncbi:MAG: NAD(P)-binding protein [Candidatus Omnitrophica bacterium]|nr:NAD(P)-binding protein [Candidatus Omnitrophota bacterium]